MEIAQELPTLPPLFALGSMAKIFNSVRIGECLKFFPLREPSVFESWNLFSGELCGVGVSADLISRVTEDLDAELKTWRSRTLPSVLPIVFFDGIIVHVRGSDAKVSPHTVYVALGIDLEGKKELIGLWIAKTEGAKF